MNRRQFLKNLGLVFTLSLFPIGLNGWAGGLTDALINTNDTRRKKLIVLFQRGAVDGLSVVIPYGESTYYDLRPGIAIPSSGGSGSALDLDGYFGLHPVLQPVMQMWNDKSLAFVHACGSPDATRSHFDGQAFMECGTPGSASADGWMNRLLSVLPGPHTATQAMSVSPVLPRILKGKLDVTNFPLYKNTGQAIPTDRPVIERAFNEMYSGTDSLSQAYMNGQSSRKELLSDLQQHMEGANNGAPPASEFAKNTQRLAQLIVQDPNIQLVFLDLGGWDTHVNQGASTGQLANNLKSLGEGLASLRQGLGRAYEDTVIIIMSEFGRTVHENGDGGTDHGHGNVLWMMGANIQGGKVYGQWPGLAKENLFEERDLAVTTDYRHAIGCVLQQHLNLSTDQIAAVFPGMPAQSGILIPFTST